jgi:RNA polymerase-binding transcription factor DksA
LQGEALRPIGGAASGGLSDLPRHIADRSSEAFEEDVALSLLENEGHILDEVEAALGRLDAGTFGMCADYGTAIPRERLTALPYTRSCRPCEEMHEAAAMRSGALHLFSAPKIASRVSRAPSSA